MKQLAIALILLSLLFACKGKLHNAPLKFNSQRLHQATVVDSMTAFNVDVQYLVAEGSNEFLAKCINDTIQNNIKLTLSSFSDSEISYNSEIEAALLGFKQTFDGMVKEQQALAPDERYSLHYDYRLVSKEMPKNDKVTCVSMEEYMFIGGENPHIFTSMYVFDNQTGKTLPLYSLIKDEVNFQVLIERYFKMAKDLDENNTFDSDDIWLDDKTNHLPLPISYSLSEDGKGIRFSYDTYEVASYDFGPTEFTIPFEELQNVLDLGKVK